MINLIKVEKEQKELLFNLFQKMLYEMTQYYANDIDEFGNIQYGYFDEYFIDKKRVAFFIYNDQELVGFLMIHSYSYFNRKIDFNLAEFTIFPKFRRRAIATQTAKLLFKKFVGNWEIKFNTKNVKAQNLWLKVTNQYKPQIIDFDIYEKVLCFNTGEDNGK